MKIRAAIFDVYNTILAVGPPLSNVDALWAGLFEETFGRPPSFDHAEFMVRATQVIAREHATARGSGIQWPEIQWPSIVLELIPDLVPLSADKFDDFLFRQMQFGRTLRLADGAAECLRQLNENGVLLGVASNAQAYTLRELSVVLQGAGLNLSMFDRNLRFWSFENGFSKPDPHVFRVLSARLEARGIRAAETLMVGDQLDNDIEPARAHGWQTWLLCVGWSGGDSGDWAALRVIVDAH